MTSQNRLLALAESEQPARGPCFSPVEAHAPGPAACCAPPPRRAWSAALQQQHAPWQLPVTEVAAQNEAPDALASAARADACATFQSNGLCNAMGPVPRAKPEHHSPTGPGWAWVEDRIPEAGPHCYTPGSARLQRSSESEDCDLINFAIDMFVPEHSPANASNCPYQTSRDHSRLDWSPENSTLEPQYQAYQTWYAPPGYHAGQPNYRISEGSQDARSPQSSASGGRSPNSEDDSESTVSDGSELQPKIFYRRAWSPEQDRLLLTLVDKYGAKNWTKLAMCIPGKSGNQLSQRWNKALDPSIKKGKWSPAEDRALVAAVGKLGKHWKAISRIIPGRTGKQCRDRFTSRLDPSLRTGRWTPEEEKLVFDAFRRHGKRWATIQKLLPHRSWYTIKWKIESATKQRPSLVQRAPDRAIKPESDNNN